MLRSNQAMERTAGSHGKEEVRFIKDEIAAKRHKVYPPRRASRRLAVESRR